MVSLLDAHQWFDPSQHNIFSTITGYVFRHGRLRNEKLHTWSIHLCNSKGMHHPQNVRNPSNLAQTVCLDSRTNSYFEGDQRVERLKALFVSDAVILCVQSLTSVCWMVWWDYVQRWIQLLYKWQKKSVFCIPLIINDKSITDCSWTNPCFRNMHEIWNPSDNRQSYCWHYANPVSTFVVLILKQVCSCWDKRPTPHVRNQMKQNP